RRNGAHPSRGQVLHVEYALEDPIIEPRLAQLSAVQDGPGTLPALLQEVEQGMIGLLDAETVEPVQDAGRAVHAEPALARPHPEPHQSANVIEIGRRAAAHRVLELRARDHLALADQLLLG